MLQTGEVLPFPKTTAGRRIAYDTPDSISARSSVALPLKYSSGESSDGLVMLTWTMRWTPACFAASKSFRVFSTASACLKSAL
jgi:hypothetical protein